MPPLSPPPSPKRPSLLGGLRKSANFTPTSDELAVMPSLQHRLATLLEYITAAQDEPSVALFKQLVDTLREQARDETNANEHMAIFIGLLRDNPNWAMGLTGFVITLISRYRQVALYTDMGILSDLSFSSQLFGLIGYRILPPPPDDKDLLYVFYQLLGTPKTRHWVNLVHDRWWIELFLLLKIPEKKQPLVVGLQANVLRALLVLSHRISGIGLHPEMIKSYPNPSENQNTFIALPIEVQLFTDQYQRQLDNPTASAAMPVLTDVALATIADPTDQLSSTATTLVQADSSQILVLTEQAADLIANIRRRIPKTGVTIRTTNMMVRQRQSLQRLELLVSLLSTDRREKKRAIIQLIHTLYQEAYNRTSFRHLFSLNTALVSQQVTEKASKVGEHYISTDKAGYRNMYKKGAIGGILIGCMATLKILGKGLPLALIGQAMLNSLIYGLGFVLIHIVGGTVATKQPAMTAAAIASTISEHNGRRLSQPKLNKLAELVVDIMRTQFIAVIGNISVAMPVALLISSLWFFTKHQPLTSLSTAQHLLHDLNPFTSLALPHAAIAGVYLYISGLIAGYYDNLAVHNKIGERIAHQPLLARVMRPEKQQALGSFIERNLGAIASNFIFGCFLGSTATIGVILGLPLDIRHIAFASANFVHGLFNLYANTGNLPDLSLVLVSLFGVAAIGIINLLVSFSLALITALRARRVEVFEWQYLFGLVWSHFMIQPSDFFVPRKEPMEYAQIDANGQLVYDDKPPAEATPPARTTKLSQAEIAIKKQAIKDKAAEKQAEKQSDSQSTSSASRLPK